MAINYRELEKALTDMNERSVLYRLVKSEMVRRGNWKAKPRGIGFKKGDDNRRTTLKPKES